MVAYMTPEGIAELCDKARPLGNGYVMACPAHDDSRASLKVSDGDKATVLYCHAGCETTAILAALGVSHEQLFHDYDPSSSGGDLLMELRAMKRRINPPPPMPQTIVALVEEAFSLPQPWHSKGVWNVWATTDEYGTPPHIAMRREKLTKDTVVYAYFKPWADDQGHDGAKLMQFVEWGMDKLKAHYRERKVQLA